MVLNGDDALLRMVGQTILIQQKVVPSVNSLGTTFCSKLTKHKHCWLIYISISNDVLEQEHIFKKQDINIQQWS